MRFEKVRIAGLGHAVPDRVVTSDELEERLAPLYDRLGLRVGRLELMSGIRERRRWEPGTRPSDVAALAGRRALEASGVAPDRIGCLVHAAVCRDFLEPATASVVHRHLELPSTCQAFDLSNACLGFANAMIVVAEMIERGTIDAGLVVAGEDGAPLVDATVRALLADPAADRATVKAAFASFTIGSAAAAMVLAREGATDAQHRLAGGVARAATEHVDLCQGDVREGHGGPLMETDSEALLHAGNRLAASTWEAFTSELGWSAASVQRIVTHQVGAAHRRLLFETLGLDVARDYPTVERLGNCGSVSLPISLALAVEDDFVRAGERVALLGIGSGLHCLMLGVEW